MRALADSVPKESALVGCLYAGGATGVNYGFSVYSEALKSDPVGLSDPEVLRIGNAPFVFGLTAPLWGHLADRMGPGPTFMCSCTLLAAAQVSEYLIAVQAIYLGPPRWSLLACACIAAAGTNLLTAQYATLPVKHYQHRRGEAVAIVKSFVGLMGAAVAQLFFLLYPDVDKASSTSFNVIIIWACVTVVACTVGAALSTGQVTNDPGEESGERLNYLFWLLLCWGILATLISCISILPSSQTVHQVLAGILVALLVVPLAVWAAWSNHGKRAAAAQPAYTQALQSPEQSFEAPSKSLLQMLSTPEAWFNFVAFNSVLAGGLVLNTSMSQIFTAAGNASGNALLLGQTVFGTGNMLGRLVSMLPSDACVRHAVPRPCFVLVILALMAVSHLLCLLLPVLGGSEYAIAVASFVGGLAFGAMYPHMVIITSELFGSAQLATNYMFYDGVVACSASVLFAQLLTAGVERAHTEPGQKDCLGAACFRGTHLVMLGFLALGMGCTAAVALRTRPLYRSISCAVRSANTQ